MIEEEIIFQPDEQGNWITVTDKGKISVRVLADKVKIYTTQEKEFEDLSFKYQTRVLVQFDLSEISKSIHSWNSGNRKGNVDLLKKFSTKYDYHLLNIKPIIQIIQFLKFSCFSCYS